MKLHFARIPEVRTIKSFGPESAEIQSIVYNSSAARDGSAFFCVIGENTDGHLYIEPAIGNGAQAIIGSNEEILSQQAKRYPSVSFVLVADVRNALAHTADFFFDSPQQELFKIGVTGTNGKTTTATYARNLFNLLGTPCGFIGTTGVETAEGKVPFEKSTPTTPIASDIHQIFSMLVDADTKAVAMEVSSTALDQQRVEGIVFDVAIHTNLSEEHLEYHKTFEHYRESKLKLFERAKAAVVNLDDPGLSGGILAVADYPVLSYSQNPSSGADLVWGNYSASAQGMRFELNYKGDVRMIEAPLFGDYNAANLTAAIATALHAGHSIDQIIAVLPDMPQVEGRFQVIRGPEERTIILDYAHTPVAIDAVLTEARKLPHRRLIALIAGIGIRDFAKMPKMAKASEGKADVLVVTVDHPGYNDPEEVVSEVIKGFSVPYMQKVLKAPTRKQAVEKALAESGPEDIILLSSGCINGAQIIEGEHIPHSDEAIIEAFFSSKTGEF